MAKFISKTGETNPTNSTATGGDWKRADAFINVRLPDANNVLQKLGALTLYTDKAAHRSLIDQLTEDPQLASELAKGLVLDFQLAKPAGPIHFQIGPKKPAAKK